MGQEGVREVQQQVDAIVAGVSDFLARFGWPIALALLAGWCAWSALQPWMREAANQRAIRHAQRKERTEVLDPDMRRVREKQAAALAAAAASAASRPGGPGKKTA